MEHIVQKFQVPHAWWFSNCHSKLHNTGSSSQVSRFQFPVTASFFNFPLY